MNTNNRMIQGYGLKYANQGENAIFLVINFYNQNEILKHKILVKWFNRLSIVGFWERQTSCSDIGLFNGTVVPNFLFKLRARLLFENLYSESLPQQPHKKQITIWKNGRSNPWWLVDRFCEGPSRFFITVCQDRPRFCHVWNALFY